MAMILPKGILENTREIYAEVASYPIVPPEKIWQYWNGKWPNASQLLAACGLIRQTVYTTTFRRLVDPTAYRLENFWWHVWGSDRRYLSGPELARLFEEFTVGPTFVPLRSPANRYEGPPTPRLKQDGGPKAEAQFSHDQGHESSSSKSNAKSPTPSSSRPPPRHPILKKSRGPSASGPRPTARFVSPAGSDDDDVKGGEVSSGSTAVSSDIPPPPIPEAQVGDSAIAPETPAPKAPSQMLPPPLPSSVKREKAVTATPPQTDMRPPPPPSGGKGEKGATPTRKIVASTAASRRRPVIPRRASSQSSAGSDAGSREGSSTATALARQRMASGAGRASSHESGASSSSQTSQSSGLTMKALGKRPAKVPRQRSTPRGVPAQGDKQQDRPVVVQQAPGVVPPQRRSTWDTTVTPERAPGRVGGTRRPPPLPVAGFVVDQGIENEPATMARTRSNMEGSRMLREASAARLPLVATTVAATTVVGTTTATAQGQFDSEGVTPTSTISEARDIPDELIFPSRPSAAALLELHFTPTPPNKAPPIPFGRSKSQLTLLLEREKARKG
ncbi:hypothetical protein QBC34DRAFT_208555 [Podospora aff. communis PSN243]|uniref:Nitrogen regulatory protein areA GATA-like domain-containing protein n=1 Tax=Podospora aff. communis PSN243 TaxID=3040156 RepID=A0AAV9GZ23_9PEZI|nr:hypothetical protein QBC34DRAFT_208555 [Podospora aff. communis PSN243]